MTLLSGYKIEMFIYAWSVTGHMSNTQFNFSKAKDYFHLPKGILTFDGGAGTPVLKKSAERTLDYITKFGGVTPGNSNSTSEYALTQIEYARSILAKFAGAESEECVCFLPSATYAFRELASSLHISEIIPKESHVVATVLDHESNVHPWEQIFGRNLHLVGIDSEGRLDMSELETIAKDFKPNLFTFPLAANTLGTVPDKDEIIRIAKQHNPSAIIVGDAVHYAAHGQMNMQAGFDFLVFNLYKLWAPHGAVMVGKEEMLREMDAGQMHHIPDTPLYARFEKGGQAWANYAAILGVLDFLYEVSEVNKKSPLNRSLTLPIRKGLHKINQYEHQLFSKLLKDLKSIPEIKVYGIKDSEAEDRVPTVCFTVQGRSSNKAVKYLSSKAIDLRSGHFYAIKLADSLDMIEHDYTPVNGGFIRATIGPYHDEKDINKLVREIKSYITSHTSSK